VLKFLAFEQVFKKQLDYFANGWRKRRIWFWSTRKIGWWSNAFCQSSWQMCRHMAHN
jgi:hypothetical protein